MTIDEMRILVMKAYPNETWEERVRGMSDEQVMALYYKFRDNGQLDREPNYYESTRKFRKRGGAEIMKTRKGDYIGKRAKINPVDDCGQISFTDLLGSV